jgi:hypothetical protein
MKYVRLEGASLAQWLPMLECLRLYPHPHRRRAEALAKYIPLKMRQGIEWVTLWRRNSKNFLQLSYDHS